MEDRKAFKILTLRPGASLTEAKKVYKTMVKSYHPDRFTNDPIRRKEGEDKLKDINLAFAQVKRIIEENQQKAFQAHAESQPKAEKQARSTQKKIEHVTGVFKDFWLNILKQFKQYQTQPVIKKNESQPHVREDQPEKQTNGKNFRQIFEEIEKNIKNKSGVNINQGEKDFMKVSSKKIHFKNKSRPRRTGNETGRVEPIRKIRPIDKIGG